MFRDHLDEMGISVKSDLPVGYNLQSHGGPSEPAFLVNEFATFNYPGFLLNPMNWLEYR